MKVGDLVKCHMGQFNSCTGESRVGVVVGFDNRGEGIHGFEDPVVCYFDQHPVTETFFYFHVEVLSETR